MNERRLLGDISGDTDRGDVSGELQEDYMQYLKKKGWSEEDLASKQVTTEQADWLAQLNERPEIVNAVAAEAIQSEAENLLESLRAEDKERSQLKINNLRKLLDTLERGLSQHNS